MIFSAETTTLLPKRRVVCFELLSFSVPPRAIYFLNKPVHSWLALALAVTMHALLVLSLGMGGSKKLSPESSHVMQVNLGSDGPSSTYTGKGASSVSESGKSQPHKADSGVTAIGKRNTAPVPDEEMKIGTPVVELPLLPIPIVPEPYYFHGSELTQKPQNILDAPPQITFVGIGDPPESVVLRLLINETGDVDRVLIENEKIFGEMEYLILSTMMKMKFKPGKIDDVPVKSQLRIELQLDPPPREIGKPLQLP